MKFNCASVLYVPVEHAVSLVILPSASITKKYTVVHLPFVL